MKLQNVMYDLLPRRWRPFALLLLALVGVAAGFSGGGRPFDDVFSEIDGRLRRHPASGDIHIVEIDARSIASIDRWPWPRSNYSQLVERLKAAGAASIVFDIDFSSRSSEAEDAHFARALAREGSQVILPTFGQAAGGGHRGWTDSLPIASLRANSALATVSIQPSEDGYVRRVPIGTVTDGVARPSLSAMVANVNGAADTDFPIDLAIDRATIPRHSFVDIRDGRFDPRQIAGKNILIGATAIEIGDRYAIPGQGAIPGVVIQALAAETLRRGIPRESGWLLPVVLALGGSAFVLRMRRRASLLAVSVAAPVLLFGLAVTMHGAFNWRFDIAPAMLILFLGAASAVLSRWLARARRHRMQDPDTGMPNRIALLASGQSRANKGVAAARILEFDKLTTGLGDAARVDLIRRLRDRIALAVGYDAIHRVEDRVLAWRIADGEDLDDKFATLRTIMLSPIDIAGRRVDVALAMGAALEAGDDVSDRTLSRAMLAADTAATNGETWHVYDVQEDEAVDRELSLLSELDEAIPNGEIGVVYQPKLCLKSDRVVGVEALVRWNHRTRGPLRPDQFIPLAERNDRIASLTLHVLEQTIANLLTWRAAGHEITGAINLSAKLLNSRSFISKLRTLIQRSELPLHLLTFEVTESATMTDAAKAVAALKSFQSLGIGISIDDYGTGQSTLSYLKKLPLNELKIDRSFVQFSHINRGDGVLVRSTVDLAHELGLKVVAEGVEDAECLVFLRSIGCDLVQGYLVGRPLEAEKLAQMLGRSIDLAA